MKNLIIFSLIALLFGSCGRWKKLMEDVIPLNKAAGALVEGGLSELQKGKTQDQLDSLVVILNMKIDSLDTTPLGKKILAGALDTLESDAFKSELSSVLDSVFSNLDSNLLSSTTTFFDSLSTDDKANNFFR